MLVHLFLASALAGPIAPDPASLDVTRLGVHGTALGGADVWTGGGGASAELRAGAAVQHGTGGALLSAAYGGVLQGWSGSGVLDGHLAQLDLALGRKSAPAASALVRGSIGGGWGETGVDAGLRLGTARKAAVEPRAVLVRRWDGASNGTGIGAGVRGFLRLSPTLDLDGRGRLVAWTGTSLPDGSYEGWLALRWTPHPDLSVVAGPAAWGSLGGVTKESVAGLVPPGSVVVRGWGSVEWWVRRGLALDLDLSVEQATGVTGYLRTRALLGVTFEIGRVRSGAQPVDEDGRVRFQVLAPAADRVEVSGSFTGWNPVALAPEPDGRWTLLLEVPPGVHEYVYLVDDRPLVPPEAALRREDDFGGTNGVLVVGP